jgi:hypothetical protein
MDDRDPSSRFVRGLTLGALLGAIIAGSSLWRRSKATRPPVRTPAPTGPTPTQRGATAPTDADAIPTDADRR